MALPAPSMIHQLATSDGFPVLVKKAAWLAAISATVRTLFQIRTLSIFPLKRLKPPPASEPICPPVADCRTMAGTPATVPTEAPFTKSSTVPDT